MAIILAEVYGESRIIFLALDVHVKNVACTYSLEHESVDGLFDSIFHCLDLLLEDNNNISNQFQELVCCISTIQTSKCQHMLKEEEQHLLQVTPNLVVLCRFILCPLHLTLQYIN
ncbi:zinc finger protein brutus-like [Quercus suber]|uniref:Zinc finger protein brutus-like n=1 Tax=Quercus suber TaxID=58331 RepID=A0AAW0JMZ0_QUESU